jgi:AraC-like DNA-binding protein
MRTVKFKIIPAPEKLAGEVECFRIAEYTGKEELSIKTFPNGLPGIVFQHDNGRSVMENIITQSGSASSIPTSFLYGPGTESSVMNYKKGSYTTTQVILKPHALKTLLGMNASALTNGFAELNEFSTEDLDIQLMEAKHEQGRIKLLTGFLLSKLKQARTKDALVEESLRLIHKNIAFIDVKFLLEHLNISERQFERRFNQTVGLAPQSYIRLKRFNEAIRLMKTGQYERLTDVAYALNFHDQSHFIRDIKAFSGITPKSLTQKENDFHHPQTGYSYI